MKRVYRIRGISFLLVICLLLTQTGCTLIGYSYGSMLDKRNSKRTTINLNSDSTLVKTGDKILVTLVNGATQRGVVTSFEWGQQLNLQTGTTITGDPKITSYRWGDLSQLETIIEPGELKRPSYMMLGLALDAVIVYLVVRGEKNSTPDRIEPGFEE